MLVDPRLERIAARLSLVDLRAVDIDADADSDLFDARGDNAFVDTYSAAGLAHAFDEYGVTAALAARGLGDHRIEVTREDPFRHRLQMRLAGTNSLIMDLRLHLVDINVDVGDARAVSVVVVDWLMMQNPQAIFSAARPQLPGQEAPGTGLGGLVHQLLVLLCRRIGRDGLVNTPERYHLARLYRRAGYIGSVDDDAIVAGVAAAGARAGLSFAALAWAVERGCVYDDDGDVYVYAPHEMMCPVSSRLAKALAHPPPPPEPGFVVDTAALLRALSERPVSGLDDVHAKQ